METFQDLKVWQKAHKLVLRIHALSIYSQDTSGRSSNSTLFSIRPKLHKARAIR